MSDDEEVGVFELNDEDAQMMLSLGWIAKDENGDMWITALGEKEIRKMLDEEAEEDSGDAE